MVCEYDLGKQEEEIQTRQWSNQMVKSNSFWVCRRNVDMENVTEGILPSFLDGKGEGRQMYFPIFKTILR